MRDAGSVSLAQDFLDAILAACGGGSVAAVEAAAGVPDEAAVVLCAGVAGKVSGVDVGAGVWIDGGCGGGDSRGSVCVGSGGGVIGGRLMAWS